LPFIRRDADILCIMREWITPEWEGIIIQCSKDMSKEKECWKEDTVTSVAFNMPELHDRNSTGAVSVQGQDQCRIRHRY
jgi:hypothetical protein